MTKVKGPKGLTRRQLLSRASAAGATFVVGAGFLAAPNAAWAVETAALKPETFATLVQMARDAAEGIEAGIAALNAAAQGKGFASYLDTGWERDRVDILRGMEDSAFFQQIRGGLVTGLYNQKAVWPIFGYEGSSFEFGGYIDRGFDDINWL